MLQYPHINPVAFQIGLIKVHWYGIMYLVGFAGAWLLALYRGKKTGRWDSTQISDFIFFIALGVIIGGRMGYMLFYDLPNFIHHPWIIFEIWDGGMSFHGGLIGVILALWLYSRKLHRSLWELTDFAAPLVPIGLAAGRLGNFINGELWGRVTTAPWGMLYPKTGPLPRHPSELYEFLLEGVLLFIILCWFSAKPRPRFAVSALFLLCYGSFRFFAECFRQPDPQLGYIAWGWLTMGQLLSAPMIVGGAIALGWIYGRQRKSHY